MEQLRGGRWHSSDDHFTSVCASHADGRERSYGGCSILIGPTFRTFRIRSHLFIGAQTARGRRTRSGTHITDFVCIGEALNFTYLSRWRHGRCERLRLEQLGVLLVRLIVLIYVDGHARQGGFRRGIGFTHAISSQGHNAPIDVAVVATD